LLLLVGFGITLGRRKQEARQQSALAMQVARMQMEIDKIMDFDLSLSSLRREVDAKFARLNSPNPALQAEIDNRIEREVNRQAERLAADLMGKFAALSKQESKYLADMQQNLELKVSSEIDKHLAKLDASL